MHMVIIWTTFREKIVPYTSSETVTNFIIYLHQNAFRIIVYFSYIHLQAGHSFTTTYADRQTAGHWKVPRRVQDLYKHS
jgi:hypothetical protein